MFKNSVTLGNLLGLRRCLQHRPAYSHAARPITWNDVSTALRPFYFIVHPDKFWNHPREKQANEHSLKQLNAYIEALLHQQKTGPLSLSFYVRQPKTAPPRQEFRNVQIRLSSQNVHKTVHEVLTSCSLATTDLDRLSSATDKQQTTTTGPPRADDASNISSFADAVLRRGPRSARDVERDASHGHWTVGGRRALDFERFLRESGPVARERSAQSAPIREETDRLSHELVTALSLVGLRWEGGWGAGPHRGCLESFRRLVQQHPEAAEALRGRTVVLGRTTGVSLDGYVMLSIEEVRHNWLTLLKTLPRGDPFVARVPLAEKELSEALRGIRVEHRKFKPSVVAQAYVQQLRKLTLALHRYIWQEGLPKDWPERLSDHQLGVEPEAGPLMLSPTGQFLAPASCPPSLLISFLTEHLSDAKQRRQLYCSQRRLETRLHAACLQALALESLSKEDDVTPDRMVVCCERLLREAPALVPLLSGCRVHVSHYCGVMQDGLFCVPWDWHGTP
ncbi:unnamed protein product [Ixodes hexagonus]